MKKGRVVISKAGRDKTKFFLVVDVIDDYIYLADGKLRKIEKPKKKNKKHLQNTNMFLNLNEPINNKRLRIMLAKLNSECEK